MDTVIRASNIKRGFPVASGTFWALKGIDLEIAKGRLTILKGRSGSGKTTLINILGALDSPTEGQVHFNGIDITNAGDRVRNQLHRQKIGFVFQSVALVSMMSAYENVEFGLRIAGYPVKERKERAEYCLSLVGLAQRMKHMPPELSGGEQQRVAIARAIANKPEVIFADEPTAELDTTTGLAIIKIFTELVEKEQSTIVMTTHDPGLMEIAQIIYEFEDGQLISTGGVGLG